MSGADCAAARLRHPDGCGGYSVEAGAGWHDALAQVERETTSLRSADFVLTSTLRDEVGLHPRKRDFKALLHVLQFVGRQVQSHLTNLVEKLEWIVGPSGHRHDESLYQAVGHAYPTGFANDQATLPVEAVFDGPHKLQVHPHLPLNLPSVPRVAGGAQ